jgi:class 3 adenylate cyclase
VAAQVPDPAPRTYADLEQELADAWAEVARLRRDLADARRREAELLEQEAATSGILRAIASSPGDLQPVLDSLAENASRLCEAEDAVIFGLDGDVLRLVAHHGPISVPTTGTELGMAATAPPLGFQVPFPLSRSYTAGRAVLDRRTTQILDPLAEPEAEFSIGRQAALRFSQGTNLATPLLREGEPRGAILIRRTTVRPFTDRQIQLLETFADQAVIAMENTRLFAELAELNRTLAARVREQVGELERVGRLRRYLSPQLADLIVSSGDESILDSHRRQITVVFCDLRGFTAFAEIAEPEEVMGVLHEYHAALGELIHRFGGTIEHFAGDGVMAFFNDPLPQPGHAECAVRMACAMRERVDGLARRWGQQGHELGFGVGIAIGYATLGRIGFEGRFDYAAIGTVTNLAARLCGEAASRQILISGRVRGMVEDLVQVEELGELTLKGFHRPVDAFNILGLRNADAAPPNEVTGQPLSDA